MWEWSRQGRRVAAQQSGLHRTWTRLDVAVDVGAGGRSPQSLAAHARRLFRERQKRRANDTSKRRRRNEFEGWVSGSDGLVGEVGSGFGRMG